MSTALTIAPPDRHGVSASSYGWDPLLTGVCLGAGEHLVRLLRAALEGNAPHVPGAEAPAGYVLAADGWPTEQVPAEISQGLDQLGCLDGRPVGLIIHAADATQAVSSLATLRASVVAAGGLPVYGGVCVEPIDATGDDAGHLADVTLHSRLALLGHHVQRFARNRLLLRAID